MTTEEAEMFASAAAELRAAGLRALHQVAAKYDGLPQATQLEALIHYSIQLTTWYDAVLAAITFTIQRPPATLH